jgi:hypothetical protein
VIAQETLSTSLNESSDHLEASPEVEAQRTQRCKKSAPVAREINAPTIQARVDVTHEFPLKVQALARAPGAKAATPDKFWCPLQ